jgi:hypothetical protein
MGFNWKKVTTFPYGKIDDAQTCQQKDFFKGMSKCWLGIVLLKTVCHWTYKKLHKENWFLKSSEEKHEKKSKIDLHVHMNVD